MKVWCGIGLIYAALSIAIRPKESYYSPIGILFIGFVCMFLWPFFLALALFSAALKWRD
jgi:hypothetical protein